MPMKRELYPDDWEAISLRIRTERAGNKCEQCGVPNGRGIVRSTVKPSRYILFDEVELFYTWPDGQAIRMSEIPDEFDLWKETRVVLTVHHIGVDKPDGSPGSPHDKMDCRDENLIALCQRCHLLADMPDHVIKRRATMKQRRLDAIAQAHKAAGQLELFE